MKYYVVDAFTSEVFSGNPAGVCPLDSWLDDEILQKIAMENNLSETAFFVPIENGYQLRWFTPKAEIELCGHATLASAYIIFHFLQPELEEIDFHTQSGILRVIKNGELLELNFPSKQANPIAVTKQMEEAIGCTILEAYEARDLLLVVDSVEAIKNVIPKAEKLMSITLGHGVIITAKDNNYDFVSRFFAPKMGVLEDPVTGSIHTALIPLWAKKLNKKKLQAYQLSPRGGELECEDLGERVKIAGKATLYLEGEIYINEMIT